MPTITTISIGQDARPRIERREAGPMARLVAGLIFLVSLGAVVVVAIVATAFLLPLLAILIVVFGVWYAWFRARRAWSRAHAPNGTLDGRENVRVIDPNRPPTA
jgi:Flp pilus assembly protein TadB